MVADVILYKSRTFSGLMHVCVADKNVCKAAWTVQVKQSALHDWLFLDTPDQ